MWRKGTHSRLWAFIVVGCIWAFVIIFVSVNVGTHKRNGDLYDTPTPVSLDFASLNQRS